MLQRNIKLMGYHILTDDKWSRVMRYVRKQLLSIEKRLRLVINTVVDCQSWLIANLNDITTEWIIVFSVTII
ncbi:Uncharacterised protein [uncultured archaeon]|nr:Uncharacterised protein [uncultured archaeon]